MAEFRLSTAAQADFNEIIDYLADVAGNRVAADYAERLRGSVNLVAEFPGIGAPRSNLGAETRITIQKAGAAAEQIGTFLGEVGSFFQDLFDKIGEFFAGLSD